MQTETTVLNIPCITLRENTEHPATIRQGTNTSVGNDINLIIEECQKILDGKRKSGSYPGIWDGHSAERIAKIIYKVYCD